MKSAWQLILKYEIWGGEVFLSQVRSIDVFTGKY